MIPANHMYYGPVPALQPPGQDYVAVYQVDSPRDKMAAILQTTFLNVFSGTKVYKFLLPGKISPKFVPKDALRNIPPLVQIMAWRRPGDKPLSELMMVSLLTHICLNELRMTCDRPPLTPSVQIILKNWPWYCKWNIWCKVKFCRVCAKLCSLQVKP